MCRMIGVRGGRLSGFLFLASLATTAPAGATTITFDDTPTGPISVYQGLVFSSSGSNGIEDAASSAMSGVRNAAVSGPNVFVSSPPDQSIQPSTSVTFTLNSGYFTSVTDQKVSVDATGFFATNTQIAKTFSIDGSGPTLETFNWTNLVEVQFTGGQFAMDNLTVNVAATSGVPEPGAVFLVSAGLAFLGSRRKPKRALRTP